MSEKVIIRLPTYSELREFMRIIAGISRAAVTEMHDRIYEQRGTPQSPVDWSNPDQWIPERLSGNDAQLALRIWHESDGRVNPRYVHWLLPFINTHELLTPDAH